MAAGTTSSSNDAATASAHRPGWAGFSSTTRTWFLGALPTRMGASPLHIEKLEPDSPVFSFLL